MRFFSIDISIYQRLQLIYFLLFGILTPYRFRLQGPDSWKGAISAIIEANTIL